MGRAFGARVLFVTQLDPSRKFGSLEECIEALATHSKARGGLLVPVFCGLVSADLAERLSGCDAPFEVQLDFQTWSWHLAKRLLRLVDYYSINVVDFSFYPPLSPYVTLLRVLRPKVRLVYTDHRSRLPELPRSKGMRHCLRRVAYHQYNRIFAISDFTRHALRYSAGLRVFRCQLFVNTTRFHADSTAREKVRARLGAESVFVALVVAHLISWKGVDIALRAIAAASDSAQLWIAGNGPELERLRALAGTLGLGARAWFFGEQMDVSPYLRGADCLICPSLWGEAMGFVNLEAMACGLPVIASRIGGIPEFVEHETTGLLVDAGSVEQTAAALCRLMDSPQLCSSLGRNGMERVRARYSREVCLERYLKNYDVVCGISDSRIDCKDDRYGRDRHIAGAADT